MISSGLADRMSAYYKGKLVSVLLKDHNVPVTEQEKQEFSKWFTIIVDDIDSEAILGTDIQRMTKSVFFLPVAAIVEEQMITPSHPDYDKVKVQMEERIQQEKKEQEMIRNQSMPTNPAPQHTLKSVAMTPQTHISIDQITKQASDLSKKWTASAVEGNQK